MSYGDGSLVPDVMPTTPSEAEILAEVIGPDRPKLTRETAESLLSLTFSPVATKHIRRLLQKNNRGTITAEERVVLEKYLRVGQFLDLLHATARLSLERPAGLMETLSRVHRSVAPT